MEYNIRRINFRSGIQPIQSDLVSCFGDPPSADSPHQREDVRDGPTVALAVLTQPDQELLVAHQVTHQGRDDDCRNLADSQAVAVDDLARGLEAKQRDGREFGEVDPVGIAPRRIRAVETRAEPPFHAWW
ncbi:uncharacterized protein PG986_014401 [Apiospora aurea]|uniref:Uncharacterized protein n=1 Tax=Apiospora aurea TaxID=335848 RepID=A0ABR1PSW9_9PEZI